MSMSKSNALMLIFSAVAASSVLASDDGEPSNANGAKQVQEKSDVWIVSGQSNACGAGELPGPDPDPRIRVFNSSEEKWQTARDPLPGLIGAKVGPWVFAARHVANERDHAIDLTALGIGGHVIGFWEEDQWLGKGLAKLIQQSATGAGVFLWYQGESNAGSPPEEYVKSLEGLIKRVRHNTGNPDLLAVIVQLSSCGYHDMSSVREAQREFVIRDGNALLVPALGRPMRDDCHLNREGHETLGQEIARALLKHRYGMTEINWPGPVLDQASLGADHRTVIAHFAEVGQLKNAEPTDFEVRREDDRIHCDAIEVGRTIITLAFNKPIELPAQLSYGGRAFPASALQDEVGNHAPAVIIDLDQEASPADEPTTAANGAGRSNS